ncbi:unnamed protein product, partial [Meganyctiphanes norvegica]
MRGDLLSHSWSSIPLYPKKLLGLAKNIDPMNHVLSVDIRLAKIIDPMNHVLSEDILMCTIPGISLISDPLPYMSKATVKILSLFIKHLSPSIGDTSRQYALCVGLQCLKDHLDHLSPQHSPVVFYNSRNLIMTLDQLLNLVLDQHVYSWYREISVHDQLADEIRYIIRYATAAVATRLTKLDLTSLIMKEVIPIILSHLDAYVEGSRRHRGNTPLEATVVHYISAGNGLHRAVKSREEEATYLRAVISSLTKYLLPAKYQDSNLAKSFLEELLGRVLIIRALDLLADPDSVNLLFILLLDRESPDVPPVRPEPEVHILKNFASVNTHPRKSVLRSNLSSVLKEQSLLYLFHSFLKDEGSINILQFCLAVEDFNRHILDPELTHEQLEQLHHEALELYHTYMVATALDRIDFPTHIVSHIREIVHGEVEDIVKLRTTRPLFQAYEHAYNLLEREYLPLFMHSHDYFANLCGSRTSQTYQKNATREGECCPRGSGSSIGKVGRKVGSGLKSFGTKMTLQPQVVQGDQEDLNFFDIDEADDISLAMSEESGSILPSVGGLESLTSSFRDLTAWRVSIPRVEQKLDPSAKPIYVFVVDVTRIDVTGERPEELQWEVERQYHEFYILETKLTEFHGEFIDNQLPPRKSLFSSKDIGFMQSRRQIFEEFLQKLLLKPNLKGSQLLFLFLKTKDEFATSFLPDVSLGRLIRDVPRKLIKERGQHLDAFINVFVSSTSLASKSKSRLEMEEVREAQEQSDSIIIPENCSLTSTMFGDNVASLPNPQQDPPPPPPATMNVSGVMDTIIYLGIRVYGLSMNAVQWLVCIRSLAGNTINAAIDWFLQRKLKQALSPPRIIKLIHIIRDALFFESPSERTESDRRTRECQLRKEVISVLPSWLQKTLTTQDLYNEGANTIVSLFQHPILNKQLSYILLDVVLEKVFPELTLDQELSPFLK